MLEARGISHRYGKHLALDDVSLNVSEGETVVVLGANGAGKTSLLKILGGLLKPSAATISLAGADITARPGHRYVDAGLALVPEGRGIFGELECART